MFEMRIAAKHFAGNPEVVVSYKKMFEMRIAAKHFKHSLLLKKLLKKLPKPTLVSLGSVRGSAKCGVLMTWCLHMCAVLDMPCKVIGLHPAAELYSHQFVLPSY